jgi:hypothetical protein
MVEPDSVLLSGDLVQDKMIPNIPMPTEHEELARDSR